MIKLINNLPCGSLSMRHQHQYDGKYRQMERHFYGYCRLRSQRCGFYDNVKTHCCMQR